MAITPVDSTAKQAAEGHDQLTFQANGSDRIELPSSEFIADAKMTRDGDDLVLETPSGEVAVIENYFSVSPSPILHSADGGALTPNLVDAFVRLPMEFAANESTNDQSPIGAVEEVKGNCTVTRADGTVETVTIGTPIYQGDIIETDAKGAVNITFIDETSMAISENARLAIDEYSYDPSTESGTTNFSVLRGLFVFTSGLIGRDDPDDVKIDTPVGSIGIRGTIIAGDINPGGESTVTVIEGAIVVTNALANTTLSQQFETVKLSGFDQPMKDMGVLSASDLGSKFHSIGEVSPSLFTTINDSARDQSNTDQPAQQNQPADSSNSPQSQQQSPQNDSLDIANLHDSSGLPSMAVAMGNTDTSVAGQPSASSTATPPPSLSTTPSTPIVPPAIGDTQQPPPSVLGTIPPAGATPSQPPVAAAPSFIDLDNLSANSKAFIISDSINNLAGYSITALGDIDRDGFDDFAFSNNTTVVGQNHSYIAYGGTGFGTSGSIPDFVSSTDINIRPNQTPSGDYSETVIEGIGDFNGDGFRDYIIGQPNNDIGITATGTATIMSGNNSSFQTFSVSGSGGLAGAQIGYDVDGVGDYNNDGFSDVIIGAPSYGDGQSFLVKGGASWGGASISLTNNIVGAPGGSAFGTSVAGLGDFNGDGYSDFVVGAPEDGSSNEGSAALFFGQKIGVPAGASATYIIGSSANLFLGTEVQGMGDINGDGKSDLLIGTAGNDSYIFFGGNSGTVETARNVQLSIPEAEFKLMGGGGVGDFNGDGYDDFVISLANSTSSTSYVVYGKSSWGGTIDLAYLQNTNNALEIRYSGATDNDDIEVKGIGDINGDGYDDFAMGLPDANGPATGNGGLAVIYGRDTGKVTAGATATADNQSFVGSSGDDTFDDGGNSNISMRGGAGNDTFRLTNTNFLGIDGGSQQSGTFYDKISVAGNLNFSNVDFESVSGIEMIQYEGSGKTMTLTLENIFNLLKTSDTGDLKIDGAAGNFLNIESSTAAGSSNSNIVAALNEMGNGATYINDVGGYKHFSIGGYDLYIDSDVTVAVT